MVIGVSDARVAPTVIGVLRRRGMVRAMVVHGGDGMDELTLTAPSTVYELRDGDVREYQVDPADLAEGIELGRASIDSGKAKAVVAALVAAADW